MTPTLLHRDADSEVWEMDHTRAEGCARLMRDGRARLAPGQGALS